MFDIIIWLLLKNTISNYESLYFVIYFLLMVSKSKKEKKKVQIYESYMVNKYINFKNKNSKIKNGYLIIS